MTYQPEAIRIADGLDQNVQIDPQTSEDEPGGYRSELDELMADAASILRSQHARIADLEAENSGLRILASGGIELFERYSTFKAKCEELEAMLDAVGAGGVGQSIKPQVQADTAQEPGAGIPASVPTGWKLVPMEPTAAMLDAAFDTEVVHTEWGVDAFVKNTAEVYGAMLAAAPEALAQQKPVAHLPCCGYTDTSALQWNPYNGVAQCHNCGQVYTAPQPTENLRCKSTQKRLATLWGYVKKEPDHFRDATQMVPARQPLTDEQILSIVRVAPALDTAEAEWLHVARAIEAAHGITGGQQ